MVYKKIMTVDNKNGNGLLILFGSQTGTSEDVAERVAREGMTLGVKPIVSSMNQFGVEKLVSISSTTVVIFIAGTTGQGDTPDNMKIFWKNLCRAHLSRDFLNKMNYAVIGLGDSSYEKYNFVGKKLYRRLKQLGANPLLDLCLGDDQHDLGYHAAVAPWLEKFWALACKECWDVINHTFQIMEPLSKFRIKDKGDLLLSEPGLSFENDEGCEMEMRQVVENTRVTSLDHWQDTRLITVDPDGSSLTFVPGDVLTTQPSNLPENIDKFFEIFPDLVSASPIYLEKNPKLPWSKISLEILKIMGPQPWSWNMIVTHILDIQSVPRLYFFELMSKFADNELEKEKLIEFCTPQGQEDLFSYCNRPKRNILEVFQDFHYTTQNIPPIFLFDLIPTIKPRSFSIASSRTQFPNSVQILVAVVEYQTKIKSKRKGLCSNWLAHHCPKGSFIPVWIQKGSFTFPPLDEDTSILMIGPGTGVAPFRSFITDNLSSWNKLLFFGCRNEDLDFYFQTEWKQLQENNHLSFKCAFSRDSQGQKRDYVQDILTKETVTLKPILASKKFYIYVAGNAKQMPKDVQQAILQLMKDAGIENAENFMELCSKRLGRYQTETWS